MNKEFFKETIHQNLNDKYDKATLTKKELAHELGMSVSSINTYICKGEGIPEYIKVGNAKNGKVLFPIVNVVNYLSNTYAVA